MKILINYQWVRRQKRNFVFVFCWNSLCWSSKCYYDAKMRYVINSSVCKFLLLICEIERISWESQRINKILFLNFNLKQFFSIQENRRFNLEYLTSTMRIQNIAFWQRGHIILSYTRLRNFYSLSKNAIFYGNDCLYCIYSKYDEFIVERLAWSVKAI